MSTDIVARPPSTLQLVGADIVSPLAARMLFWRVRFLRPSPDLHQVPFLFWLVDVLRPQRVVALGLEDAVAYFAVCQAVDKLSLTALTSGYGRWEREPGQPQVPAALSEHNDELYGDFSRLTAGTLSETPPGSVDLLVLHPGVEATEVEAIWLPRLSERAVILAMGAGGPRPDDAYGALVDRIAEGRAVVTLHGGPGARVVLHGPRQPDRLIGLAALGPGQPGHAEVHGVFERLGAACHFEQASRSSAARAVSARKKQDLSEKALIEARRAAVASDAANKALNAAYDARHAEARLLQARLFDLTLAAERDAATIRDALAREQALETCLTEARDAEARARAEAAALADTAAEDEAAHKAAALEASAALERALQRIEDLSAEVATLTRDLAGIGREHDAEVRLAGDRSAALTGAGAEVDRLTGEIVILTRLLERSRLAQDATGAASPVSDAPPVADTALHTTARIDALIAAFDEERRALVDELAAGHATIGQMQTEVADLRMRTAAVQSALEAILQSTAWRLTAPARRLIDLARPRRP